MRDGLKVRFAETSDCAEIQRIYAPYVLQTPASFEEAAPDLAEIERRFSAGSDQFPWLIAELNGEVAGYCYAGLHKTRASYRWSVDTSIYLDDQFRGKGIGRKLYSRLLEMVKRQGFHRCYGGITLPNNSSVGLHEALGFRKIAHYTAVGYKFGRWHDVGWWELMLQPLAAPIQETSPIGDLRDATEIQRLL